MFEFISNKAYRDILNRDFEELEKCMEAVASKAAVVMSGSIIESIFIEYFISNPPNGKTKSQILKLKLFQLIELAEKTGLISKKVKDLSSIIRNYRNYIHPAKEVRMNEFIDEETASIAYSLLKLIIKEVEQKYTVLYGMTAEKLFNKLLSDSSAYSIFEKLMSKTNKVEIERLGELITDYYLEKNNSENNVRSFATKYLDIIKPKLDDNSIQKQLLKLKGEVEHGEREKALALFDLYGERLGLLDKESIDLIIDYMYSVIGRCSFFPSEFENLTRFRSTNFYEHLKIYNDKKENKEKYIEIIKSIVENLQHKESKKRWIYIDIYKQMTSQMDSKKLDEYLKKNVSEKDFNSFKLIFENDDDLPF